MDFTSTDNNPSRGGHQLESRASLRGTAGSRAMAGDSGGGTVIFGGGLAGLAAGYCLTAGGRKATVLEADHAVGGLSKTLRMGEFLFDIGGHRFHTSNEEVDAMIRGLLGEELVTVERKSHIFMRGRFFDYPLKPANAMFGLGPATVLRILADYGIQKLRGLAGRKPDVSLEDWVVGNFGRTMFNIYFKEYSEKVWGLDCQRISQGWVARRIQGLSLSTAIKNAFFKFSGRDIPTLADSFLYPATGIGRIAERFAGHIRSSNRVLTGTRVERLLRDGARLRGAEVNSADGPRVIEGDQYISTIPLNSLVGMLDPAPPPDVLEAARSLGFRDLAIVALAVDRQSVTDQSWVYIPEKKFPFGRLHEPKCWSPKMAPPGQTLVVVEFFCFRGDYIWNSTDEELRKVTVEGLRELGFIRDGEALEAMVLRVPRAYPLFEVGYEEHCERIYEYLGAFENLHIAGRSGMFQYQNMDHAIASGMEAAGRLTGAGKP